MTNFFRVCKHRTAELAELLDVECIHRGRFKDLRDVDPRDELKRALRFFYLTRYSFGSKGEHFAQASARAPRVKSLVHVRGLLESTAKRLASVQIETQDWSTILRRYDATTTFFYLDPPYVDFKDNARYTTLEVEVRDRLFSSLAGLTGRFLLSFDDHPEIWRRAKAHRFHVCEVQVP